MKKTRTITVLLTLVAVVLVTQLFGTVKPKAVVNTKVLKAAVTTVNPQAALLAAQEWLKSIGYNYTLEQVQNCKKLKLQLYGQDYGPKITDDTLIHLQVMPKMEEVHLPRWIGDQGLAKLAGLTKMKIMDVPISRVTDEGLEYLKDMSDLKTLLISGTNVTDAGIAKITHLKNLQMIGLDGTKITDAGVAYFSQLPNMKCLMLSRTNITDTSVPVLKTLTWLTRLDIQGVKITPAGYNEIKAALPNCLIYYY